MLPQAQRQPIFVDDATYANQYDYTTDSSSNSIVVYSGWAEPGSLTSAAVWRICKFSYVVVGNDTVVSARQWADGNNKFDNIWDNRASLTYS